MGSGLVLGFDIGGTQTRCALASVDAPASILWHTLMPTPEGDVTFLLDSLASAVAAIDTQQEKLTGVGCAVCGVTDAARGIVMDAPNIPGWQKVPLGRLLEDRWGVPAVLVNDVNAAALGEHALGAGQGCHSLVYLTISTGVAAGIMVRGQLLEGAHHAAGEIAYFLPERQHIDESWKPNGCLEMLSAGMGLAQIWSTVRGKPMQASDVFAAAHAGDIEAKRLIARAADYLAQAAVALGAIIDPEKIILGGSIAQHQSLLVDRIREVVTKTLPFPPDVVLAALGDEAPLVGALMLAACAAPK